MTRFLVMLALFIVSVNGWADSLSPSSVRNRVLVEGRRPPLPGYLAEVEVSLGGVVRRGRIIVTGDGGVHLEHLDEPALRWVNGILGQEPSTWNGWDSRRFRAGPVRRVWGRLGQIDVLVEAHTPDACLKISRHQLLTAR